MPFLFGARFGPIFGDISGMFTWITRWWFQICFISIPTWGNNPILTNIFQWEFNGVETTKQEKNTTKNPPVSTAPCLFLPLGQEGRPKTGFSRSKSSPWKNHHHHPEFQWDWHGIFRYLHWPYKNKRNPCIAKYTIFGDISGMFTWITRWWFQICFISIPTWGRWTQFDDHIFQMGWFNHQLDNFCVFKGRLAVSFRAVFDKVKINRPDILP